VGAFTLAGGDGDGGTYFNDLEETGIKVVKVVLKLVFQEVLETVTACPTFISRK